MNLCGARPIVEIELMVLAEEMNTWINEVCDEKLIINQIQYTLPEPPFWSAVLLDFWLLLDLRKANLRDAKWFPAFFFSKKSKF